MNSHRVRRSIVRERFAQSAILSAVLVGLAGCGNSPWKSSYRPSGEVVGMAEYRGPVRVREVPWERVQGTLDELYSEVVASDVPVEEWPEDRRLARHGRLLKGLQVTTDPSAVRVLGRSEFRSTDTLRPDDGKLADLARSVGADTVVWSSLYMGQADIIRSEPVTEYRSGSYSPRGGGPSRTYSDSSTIYVPVYVKADERAWVAYFLREGVGEQTRR